MNKTEEYSNDIPQGQKQFLLGNLIKKRERMQEQLDRLNSRIEELKPLDVNSTIDKMFDSPLDKVDRLCKQAKSRYQTKGGKEWIKQ